MLNFELQKEKDRIIEALIAVNVPKEQAEIVADCFATADAYGVTSHGSAFLPAHISRVERGGYNLSPNLKVIRKTASFAVIDGDNAFGPVSATYCMNYAINACRKTGIYTVLSCNNNTFGPAFYYPLLAAKEGLIGIASSNSPAQMAPIGGKEKMLGTNPFSIVVPTNDEPIILDMATSVVAKSKFKEYKLAGKKLPEGWALDVEGNSTIDPDEAMQGLVLPMAGFKGYGIALMIDVLSGVLSGAAYLNKVGRFYSETNDCMNVGFNFIVIDPKQVLGDEYREVISDFVKTLRESETIAGQEVILPGDDRINFYRRIIK